MLQFPLAPARAARLLVLASRAAKPRAVRQVEGTLHKIADAHQPKLEVAVRYAFAMARKAMRGPLEDHNTTYAVAYGIATLREELQRVLPKTLRRMFVAGGEVAAGGLRTLGDFEGHPFRGNQYTDGISTEDAEKLLTSTLDDIGGLPKADASNWANVYGETQKQILLKSFEPELPKLHSALEEKLGKEFNVYRAKSKDDKSEGIVSFALSREMAEAFLGRGAADTLTVARISAKDVLAIGSIKQTEVLVDTRGKKLKALAFRAAKRETKPKLDFTFNARTQSAIDWADRHAAEMIDHISETSREAINNAVAEYLESGNRRDLLDEILAAVGDEQRAKLIARHEPMAAVHAGQRESWEQATQAGLLTGDEEREWIIVGDEKVCPTCEGLEGKRAKLGEVYTSDDGEEFEGPPAHVMCRCSEGITA